VPVLLFNVSVSLALSIVPWRFTVPPVRTKFGRFKASVVSVPRKFNEPPAMRIVPVLDQLAAPTSSSVELLASTSPWFTSVIVLAPGKSLNLPT
jgi:hypothetical protein